MNNSCYSTLVEQSKSYLTITLDLEQPVEIQDFAAFFSGLGSQFDRFLLSEHPRMKGKAQMYVKEVRKGSIIADLVPNIPDLVGYMDNVLIVGGFGALFSKRVRKAITGQFIDGASRPEIEEIGKTVRSLSKDSKGTLKIESVELKNGIWNKDVLIKFDTADARKAEATLDRQKKELEAVDNSDYKRVLMIFERSRKSDTDIAKPTGELVIIEEINEKPKALIYGSEMIEQQIKHEIREADDNIYKKGFMVDVNTRMRAGRVVGYTVGAIHQVIDLPDS